MTPDERIRLGILERDLEKLQWDFNELKAENVRLAKELKASKKTISDVAKTADQGQNLITQLIRRVAKT